MKRRSLVLAAAAAPFFYATRAHSQDAQTLRLGLGMPAQREVMRGVLGRPVRLSQVRGRQGTLVVFLSNHCPWAQAWEARIVELGNACRGRQIGAVAINANSNENYTRDMHARMAEQASSVGFSLRYSPDTFEEMQERANASSMRFPYAQDRHSRVARAFGATKTPEAFLFDAAARLVYHGAIDDNPFRPDDVREHFLRDALDAMDSGRPIQNAHTRSIGCRIAFRSES